VETVLPDSGRIKAIGIKKPDRAAYMRAYRLANAERIRAQERERYALSRNIIDNKEDQ
jgi:hypothetical protein